MAATQPGTAATCNSIPVAAGAWKGCFQRGFSLPKNLLLVVSREQPDAGPPHAVPRPQGSLATRCLGAADALRAPQGCKRCQKMEKREKKCIWGFILIPVKAAPAVSAGELSQISEAAAVWGLGAMGDVGPCTPLSITCWPHPAPPSSGSPSCPPLPDSGSAASLSPKERLKG